MTLTVLWEQKKRREKKILSSIFLHVVMNGGWLAKAEVIHHEL